MVKSSVVLDSVVHSTIVLISAVLFQNSKSVDISSTVLIRLVYSSIIIINVDLKSEGISGIVLISVVLFQSSSLECI